jgi:predicted O-linked N-acetylglucosamine transferase (SPINDLY family)
LRCLGLDELIATSHAEYVRLVAALVRDQPWRNSVRLRITSKRPLLYRQRAAVDALSDFLAALPR